MPLTLVTGPANAGKAGVVLDAVRAAHARTQDALLVVPTHADVARYRAELAGDGLVEGVRVERFEGLLAEVVHRAGHCTERPLGRRARERVLAAALEEVAARGTSVAEVSAEMVGETRARGARAHAPPATPGVVRTLAALVAELEVERVTPARLRGALREWAAADPGAAAHAGALGDLFDAYRRALARLQRTSPEQRAARALDTLRRAPALWGATPVAVYGFDDFTRLQLDALETLAAAVGAPVTVSLAYEPGRVAFAARGDTFQRLAPLAAEHLRLAPRADHYAPAARAALHHLERHLFEADAPTPLPAGGAVRLLEGGGERAELELVADEIAALLARGWAPAEIALTHRAPATIADLLAEVLTARGIPFALRRPLPFAHTATGRALVGLLRVAFPARLEGERGAGAGARDGGHGVDAGPLDADGVGDLLVWLRAPGVLPDPERADELEWRARRAGVRSAPRARALWESEHGPLEAVEQLQAAAHRGPAALLKRAAAELARLGYPSAHDTCARAVGAAALRELGELARAAPALAPDAHTLAAVLGDLEVVVGVQAAGAAEAVAVLDPLALRARRVRALFVCGLQEGVFPAPAPPEPYLSAEDRHALAAASGLRLGRSVDAVARERYLMYAAVSRPWEVLALSWHTADDDGLPTPRSLFVDDVCDLFVGDGRGRRRAQGEVAQPLAATPPEPIAPLRDPRVLAELSERRLWSASGLQAWADCPVRWFVERLLAAHDLEPDAEPLARGGLAHAVLRDVLAGLREETGSARLTPTRLPRARELLHAALAARAGERPLSTAPERVPGARRRLEADLERYLQHAAGGDGGSETPDGSRGAAGSRGGSAGLKGAAGSGGEPQGTPLPPAPLEPTHLELPFGFPDAPGGLPPLDLGDGILVRGVIDRVDLAPDGAAVVYDYKGARAPAPDRWAAERDFQVALYMRAVEALPGTHAVGGFYQPLAGRDLRARGVLAEGEGVALECVRGDTRPAAAVQELVEEVVAAARLAAAQARAGALEARPGTCGFGGGGCRYPSICRCEW